MGSGDRVDVVVVGGGAAGCVIAAGLARRSEARVLLLEAGPDLRHEAPPEWHDGWRLPKVPDWGYASERNDGSVGDPLRRGRVLGGTSWLTRFAVRGAAADFDTWAMNGNSGWSFDDVLPTFRRIEADRDFGDVAWHGRDGRLPITRYPDVALTRVHQAAVAALESAGVPRIADHNRPGAVGVGRLPMSSIDGRRVTALDAWIGMDVPERLTIRAEAPVARVVLDGRRATGVELVEGTRIEAAAVIVCAGTYGSPAILLRSGIGAAGHLAEMGIELAIDLPGVGENLADHPAVEFDPGLRGSAVAGAPILHSIATWRSAGADPDGGADLMTWISDPIEADPTVWLDVILLKPASRGTVRLRSADPTDPPRIRLPGLAAAEDRTRIEDGLAFLMEVADRPEIRAAATEPAPSRPRSRSDLAERIAEASYSLPHVVGTCAMGPDPERGAVVDANARVHGIDGLSVVDGSILPEPPSGFPHLVTIMAAEHLLDRWLARS
jgi:choline dehydrogenase